MFLIDDWWIFLYNPLISKKYRFSYLIMEELVHYHHRQILYKIILLCYIFFFKKHMKITDYNKRAIIKMKFGINIGYYTCHYMEKYFSIYSIWWLPIYLKEDLWFIEISMNYLTIIINIQISSISLRELLSILEINHSFLYIFSQIKNKDFNIHLLYTNCQEIAINKKLIMIYLYFPYLSLYWCYL
jgi:hypothetical protein